MFHFSHSFTEKFFGGDYLSHPHPGSWLWAGGTRGAKMQALQQLNRMVAAYLILCVITSVSMVKFMYITHLIIRHASGRCIAA